MGGVVEEDEVGGLCCVEELTQVCTLRCLIFKSLGEGAGVAMVGLRTVFLSFFLSFSFHCVCDMEVTSLIYINHKIS